MVNNVEDLKAINKTVSKIINYVNKREIDRSTLHNFDGLFQLVHADVANLKFLGKSATHSKYCQLIVDVLSTKIYTYLVRSQKRLAKKLQKFDTEVSKKTNNNQKMSLLVDQEFQQNKIKQLNKKYLVEMFSTKVCGGKYFGAEQKICELKKRISKFNLTNNKLKQITPKMLIKSRQMT